MTVFSIEESLIRRLKAISNDATLLKKPTIHRSESVMRYRYALALSLATTCLIIAGCGSSEMESDEPEVEMSEDVLWSVRISPTGITSNLTGPVVRSDGMIYVGGAVRDGSKTKSCLFEVNPDGTIVRRLVGSPKATTMSVVVSSHDVVYATDREGGLYSLPFSGEGVFQADRMKDFGITRYMTSLLAVANGTVYASNGEGLYTISVGYDAQIGLSPAGPVDMFEEVSGSRSFTWGKDYGTPFHGGSSVGYEGRLIQSDSSGGIVAYSRESEKLWSYPTGSLSSAPRVGHNWTIYVAGATKLYALTANGELKWTYEHPNRLNGSPLIGQSAVYFTDGMGHVIAISQTGELVWSKKVGQNPTSPALGPSGALYVRCLKGFLYALMPPI
jgi:hypothetical protein